MGQHIKASIGAFQRPQILFLLQFYRTFARIMQDWKINYSNDTFENAAR